MTMLFKYGLCVAILAVSLRNVRAISKEEMAAIQEKILPHILECSKEHGLSEGQLKEAKEAENIDGIDDCFFACVFKKAEFINDKGLFDAKKATEKTTGLLTKEEDVKKVTSVIDECAETVNGENVKDGESGCERGKLLMTCLVKNKDKFFEGLD